MRLRILIMALLLTACTSASPSPSVEVTQSPSPTEEPSPTQRPSPTPIPTPQGPTPIPSYVRPTPTPQPSFFVYTVASGDSLDKIAKHFGTTGKSIAYWNRTTYPSLDPESSKYKPNDIKVGWTLLLIPNKETDPENLPPPSGQPSEEPTAVPSALF